MSTVPPLPDDDFTPPPQPASRVQTAPRVRSTSTPVPPSGYVQAPAPVPSQTSPWQSPIVAALAGAMGAAVIMLVGLWLLLPILAPERDPRPEDQLVAACREYRKTQGQAFIDVAGRVLAGDLRTKTDTVKALQDHAKPVAEHLDALMRLYIDEKGTIKDPNKVADLLFDVGKALNRR